MSKNKQIIASLFYISVANKNHKKKKKSNIHYSNKIIKLIPTINYKILVPAEFSVALSHIYATSMHIFAIIDVIIDNSTNTHFLICLQNFWPGYVIV